MSGADIHISHSRLRRLYEYWGEKRDGRAMPSRDDIDPVDIRYVLGDVMLVDVIGEAPFRFRIRLHGSNFVERSGCDITGQMLDQLPANEFRGLVPQRWTEVATKGQPLHYRCNSELDGRLLRYECIILPLSADGTNVDMELVAMIMTNASEMAR